MMSCTSLSYTSWLSDRANDSFLLLSSSLDLEPEVALRARLNSLYAASM